MGSLRRLLLQLRQGRLQSYRDKDLTIERGSNRDSFKVYQGKQLIIDCRDGNIFLSNSLDNYTKAKLSRTIIRYYPNTKLGKAV